MPRTIKIQLFSLILVLSCGAWLIARHSLLNVGYWVSSNPYQPIQLTLEMFPDGSYRSNAIISEPVPNFLVLSRLKPAGWVSPQEAGAPIPTESTGTWRIRPNFYRAEDAEICLEPDDRSLLLFGRKPSEIVFFDEEFCFDLDIRSELFLDEYFIYPQEREMHFSYGSAYVRYRHSSK